MPKKETGVELIAKERKEQLEKHGHAVEEDVLFNDGCQLAIMACILAFPFEYTTDSADFPEGWKEDIVRKMLRKDRIGQLTVAGALLAAEIDRLLASHEEFKR